MDNEKTIIMFCANEQAETAHILDIDGNGEIVLTCPCGRFIKLPASTDAAGLKTYAEAHKASNAGQISQASLDEKKAKLLADLATDPEAAT